TGEVFEVVPSETTNQGRSRTDLFRVPVIVIPHAAWGTWGTSSAGGEASSLSRSSVNLHHDTPEEFQRIQASAEINLPCREQHEHTEACHFYGFHDFRRAFATMNADNLTADALQALMRHKSYQTTRVYIN